VARVGRGVLAAPLRVTGVLRNLIAFGQNTRRRGGTLFILKRAGDFTLRTFSKSVYCFIDKNTV